MFTVERRAGRLVETRVGSLDDPEEIDRFGLAFKRHVDELDRVVIVGDYRAVRVLAPEAAARFAALFNRTNPKVIRSALLLDAENATFALQIERLVREAQNPERRTFRDGAALVHWLDELLTPDEQAELARFLGTH